MKLSLGCLFIVFFTRAAAQFAPEPDPHRGMYVDKFFKTSLSNSSLIDPAYSILAVDTNRDGIFEKEDAVLSYCAQNHITYINLYDLHKILGRHFMAWDQNKLRNTDLEEHLCRFIRKAKTQYGITQVGAIGGSVSFFDSLSTYFDRYPATAPYRLSGAIRQSPYFDTTLYAVERVHPAGSQAGREAELLKFCLRTMDFNSCQCQADIDVLNIEYEFWVGCATEFPNFVDILRAMHALKDMYNLDHPGNPLIAEVYTAALSYCSPSFGIPAVVETMDGCVSCSPCSSCTNPHPRMADRILYAWFTNTPGGIVIADQNHFESSLTEDSTDFHPIFYSECYRTGGTADFIGTWFPLSPSNNIFTADEIYYSNWRNHSGVAFGTPRQNDVQPGGSHWFTAMHMVNHLENPPVLQNTGPYCTTGAPVQVTFNYYGPIENGIAFQFWITRDDDGSNVYPPAGGRINGTSNVFQPATPTSSLVKNINFEDTFLFRPVVLPEGTYTAHLLLNYENGNGSSYECKNKVIVGTRPHLEVIGEREFCEGDFTFLKASGSSSFYTWHRNSEQFPGTTSTQMINKDGDYYCTVTGSGSCGGVSDTIHVHVKPNPSLAVNATCNGNGTATIKTNLLPANPAPTSVNGTAGLTYRWNTGDTTDQITVTPPTSNTVYRVNVTNPYNGCLRTAQITLKSPLVQNYTGSVNINIPPSSPCANDGRLTAIITPYNGGPVSYLWSNGETTPVITNAGYGTYSVAINIWSDGCTAYGTATVGTPPANEPVVTPAILPARCHDASDGSIQLVLSGGNAPFTFFWPGLNDDSIHDPFAQNQSQLFPGLYSVVVKDASGCTFSYSWEVPWQFTSPVISSVTTNPVTGCSGSTTGSASVSVSGGSPPYTYAWGDSGHQTTAVATSLGAGSVRVTVTDANGCNAKAFADVSSVNLPLSVTVLDSSRQSASCPASADGALYLELCGGISPYVLSSPWLGDSVFAMRDGLAAGNYPIDITDSLGCLYHTELTVAQPEAISVFPASYPATCTGCTNGRIELSYSGGSPPFQVSWQPSSGTRNGNLIYGLAAGIYTICITDRNNCTTCVQDTVTELPASVFSLAIDDLLEVYPNPLSELTVVKIRKGISFHGTLFVKGIRGNLVKRYPITADDPVYLDAENLTPGIYLLTVLNETNAENSGAKKLVVVY